MQILGQDFDWDRLQLSAKSYRRCPGFYLMIDEFKNKYWTVKRLAIYYLFLLWNFCFALQQVLQCCCHTVKSYKLKRLAKIAHAPLYSGYSIHLITFHCEWLYGHLKKFQLRQLAVQSGSKLYMKSHFYFIPKFSYKLIRFFTELLCIKIW